MTIPTTIQEIGAWVTGAGLAGLSESLLLEQFCQRMRAAGIPLARASAMVDTLHPVFEGRAFRWRHDHSEDSPLVEYGRTSGTSEAAAQWQRSPFYHLDQTGEALLRRRLARGDPPDFPVVEELRDSGYTDYLAMIQRFDEEGVVGGMDCIYSSWVTDAPDGFTDAQVDAIQHLVPSLALALKCRSLARIAATLVETYLGRDAGRRVLGGRIMRGVAEQIGAVLWYSDLRGYTRISDSSSPDQIIPLLNDYAEAVISSIHDAGGDVLKLIGDGVLAIFAADDPATACSCALDGRGACPRAASPP